MAKQKRVSLKILKQVLVLIDRHKIDELKFNDIYIKKSKHLFTETELKRAGVNSQSVSIGNSEPTTIDELDAAIRREMGIQ